MPATYLTARPDGVVIQLRVQPRASRSAIAGEHGGSLKVTVTAPPVDSAANEAVIELIADKLGVPKSHVSIIRGQTGRNKSVHVAGVAMADAESKLRPPGS